LIRTDGGGGTYDFLRWLSGQGLSYLVGFGLSQDMVDKINQIPDQGWIPADDPDGKVREGAWVSELTGMLELQTWPAGMRVVIRAERPHPGAQLRFTDVDGTGWACLSPTPPAGNLRTWSCGTATGPAAKAGSAMQRTPACGTCLPHCVRAKPDLDRHRPVGDGADCVAAAAGPGRHRSAPLGTERIRLQLLSVAGPIARRSRRVWLLTRLHAL